MSEIKDPLSPPRIVQATAMYCTSLRENLSMVEREVDRRLAMQLAVEVQNNYSETLDSGVPGYARKEVRLMVATPEQFHNAVIRAAHKMNMGYPDPIIF